MLSQSTPSTSKDQKTQITKRKKLQKKEWTEVFKNIMGPCSRETREKQKMAAKQQKKAKQRRDSRVVSSFDPVLHEEAVAKGETRTEAVEAEVLEEEASADVEADNARCVEASTAEAPSFLLRKGPKQMRMTT
jgi:hypothetical protein